MNNDFTVIHYLLPVTLAHTTYILLDSTQHTLHIQLLYSIHHLQQPYICKFCSYSFSQQ